MIKSVSLAATVLVATVGFAPVSAGVGPWADGARASARLISAGINDQGHLDAGIEIVLPRGWKTYWRYPGDSGIAPQIDFSGSRNVGAVQVAFPTPRRYDDGYSVINIYEDRVVLPVSAPVLNPDDEVILSVDLQLGVCEKICIPDSVSLELEVPVTEYQAERDGYASAVLDTARESLPQAPQPGVFSVVHVERTGGTDKRPVFDVKAHVPEPDKADVFVDGPEGWYPNVPKYAGQDGDAAVYRVEFSLMGTESPIEGAHLHLVIVSGAHAIEQSVQLD